MSEYEQHFRDVGLALRSFERSIDSAVMDGCDLLKAATEKSMTIGIAGPVSQPIIAQLFGSLQLAIQARSQACDAHLQLKDFRTVVRKGPMAFGDCCGTPSSPSGEAPDLRVVA
jgi:hypothetical protein